jgi:checkpoint serine/threonine-protein kinase
MAPSATREELEAERDALRTAVTDARAGGAEDPVGAYHAYVGWLIRHAPGEKQRLFELLKEATDAHKDDQSYYFDRRFLDLWCWYAARVNRPGAVYAFCLKRKIGTVFAKLFVEYAQFLERSGE